MMRAEKTFSWGKIEVRFLVTDPPSDNATALAIVQAHSEILTVISKLGGMTEADMFERSFERPRNFYKLPPADQWAIDKMLGILDWEGGDRTPAEQKRIAEHYEK